MPQHGRILRMVWHRPGDDLAVGGITDPAYMNPNQRIIFARLRNGNVRNYQTARLVNYE
jgi:hypothetical protein